MGMVKWKLESATGSEDAKGPKYTLEYTVTMDSPMDLSLSVIGAMSWRIGDAYQVGNDYDPRARALVAGAVPVPANNFLWKYTVEFGIPDSKDTANPLEEPPEIELTFAQNKRPFDRDINGKAVANTIGDRFDDILERDDSQPVLRITRNEPRSMAMFGVNLRDNVNRSVWQGAPRRTVKMQAPTVRVRQHNLIGKYLEKSYEFKFSDDTWQFILLNQGYYELRDGRTPDDPKKRIRIKDSDNKEITTPLALTQAGLRLPDGVPPVWITFDGYRESILPDFGQLV